MGVTVTEPGGHSVVVFLHRAGVEPEAVLVEAHGSLHVGDWKSRMRELHDLLLMPVA